MGKITICENAWLYKVRDGKINIYEGTVYSSTNGHLHFVTTDNKHMGCPRAIGLVSNDSIWLNYRDDNIALNRIYYVKSQCLLKLTNRVNREKETLKLLLEEL